MSVSYSANLAATGGSGSYTWSATGLPSYLSLSGATGAITGTPTSTAGSPFSVKVTATDTASYTGNTASKSFSLTVNAAPALVSLALSGSPSLTYSGTPVTYDLSGLALTGKDQSGDVYDITGQIPIWTVTSGPANVSGHILTITGGGAVTVNASIGTITSNDLGLDVYVPSSNGGGVESFPILSAPPSYFERY